MVIDDQELNRLLELAVKSGHLFVAEDVYEQLVRATNIVKYRAYSSLVGIEIISLRFLEPGTIMAIDHQESSRFEVTSL